MFRLGRCFLVFIFSLSSSGWSNLFISFDTLHSYASLLDTGRKPEDCPRCRGYNAHCYQSFPVSRTQLRITGGSPFNTAERQKPTIRSGNNCLEGDVLWYCGYNDHTTLKKGYLNNTRQEHFSNKNKRCQ